MPFAIPMIWREPRDHVTDCYFCLTNISGFSAKSKKHITYPDLPSAMRPVPHSDDLPIPNPPESYKLSSSESGDDDEMEHDIDKEFTASSSSVPHLLTQVDLNDIVRDLNLSKSQGELLGSRLQGWNLLATGTKVSIFRQ